MSYCTQQDLEQRISAAQLKQLTNDAWSATPPTLSVAAHANGSLIGTSYYVVTALNNLGETILSNEITYTVAGGNATARLSWTQVANATSYKIYKTLVSGVYADPCLLKQTTVLTFDDDGSISTLLTGAPPTNAAMPDPTIVAAMIARADSDIDSKAGQVYYTPFVVPTTCDSIPIPIKQVSIDLALQYCFLRRPSEVGISQFWLDNFKAANDRLDRIADLSEYLDGNPKLKSKEIDAIYNPVIFDFNNQNSPYGRF